MNIELLRLQNRWQLILSKLIIGKIEKVFIAQSTSKWEFLTTNSFNLNAM